VVSVGSCSSAVVAGYGCGLPGYVARCLVLRDVACTLLRLRRVVATRFTLPAWFTRLVVCGLFTYALYCRCGCRGLVYAFAAGFGSAVCGLLVRCWLCLPPWFTVCGCRLWLRLDCSFATFITSCSAVLFMPLPVVAGSPGSSFRHGSLRVCLRSARFGFLRCACVCLRFPYAAVRLRFIASAWFTCVRVCCILRHLRCGSSVRLRVWRVACSFGCSPRGTPLRCRGSTCSSCVACWVGLFAVLYALRLLVGHSRLHRVRLLVAFTVTCVALPPLLVDICGCLLHSSACRVLRFTYLVAALRGLPGLPRFTALPYGDCRYALRVCYGWLPLLQFSFLAVATFTFVWFGCGLVSPHWIYSALTFVTVTERLVPLLCWFFMPLLPVTLPVHRCYLLRCILRCVRAWSRLILVLLRSSVCGSLQFCCSVAVCTVRLPVIRLVYVAHGS